MKTAIIAGMLYLAFAPIATAKDISKTARYRKLSKDNRKGQLTEKEYKFLRKHMPTGDGSRGLTFRELEAIDPWYRDNK